MSVLLPLGLLVALGAACVLLALIRAGARDDCDLALARHAALAAAAGVSADLDADAATWKSM